MLPAIPMRSNQAGKPHDTRQCDKTRRSDHEKQVVAWFRVHVEPRVQHVLVSTFNLHSLFRTLVHGGWPAFGAMSTYVWLAAGLNYCSSADHPAVHLGRVHTPAPRTRPGMYSISWFLPELSCWREGVEAFTPENISTIECSDAVLLQAHRNLDRTENPIHPSTVVRLAKLHAILLVAPVCRTRKSKEFHLGFETLAYGLQNTDSRMCMPGASSLLFVAGAVYERHHQRGELSKTTIARICATLCYTVGCLTCAIPSLVAHLSLSRRRFATHSSYQEIFPRSFSVGLALVIVEVARQEAE